MLKQNVDAENLHAALPFWSTNNSDDDFHQHTAL